VVRGWCAPHSIVPIRETITPGEKKEGLVVGEFNF
jgi:hypothetical protein